MDFSKEINDEDVICMYGVTKDFNKLHDEHKRFYHSKYNLDVMPKYISFIDPQYISEAETDMSNYFEAINAKIKHYNKHDNRYGDLVKKQYMNIEHLYDGKFCIFNERPFYF
jgi:hypothetical protein